MPFQPLFFSFNKHIDLQIMRRYSAKITLFTARYTDHGMTDCRQFFDLSNDSLDHAMNSNNSARGKITVSTKY